MNKNLKSFLLSSLVVCTGLVTQKIQTTPALNELCGIVALGATFYSAFNVVNCYETMDDVTRVPIMNHSKIIHAAKAESVVGKYLYATAVSLLVTVNCFWNA